MIVVGRVHNLPDDGTTQAKIAPHGNNDKEMNAIKEQPVFELNWIEIKIVLCLTRAS